MELVLLNMVPLLRSMLPLCTADNGTSAPENATCLHLLIYYFLTKHMSSAPVHMTTAVPACISRWLTKPPQFSASISC
jgi:hypothetical protein